MRPLFRPLHHLVAIVVATLLAIGLGSAATAAESTATSPSMPAAASPVRSPAARTITNCRTSEIPCRYRIVKFAYGSRKYNMIKRELILRPARSNPLPNCWAVGSHTYAMQIFEDGSSRIREYGCTVIRPVYARGWGWSWLTSPTFWSTTWKVTTCVAAITIALVPMLKAARLIRELGGITETAKLIVGAGTWADLRASVPALAEQILGIGAVTDACF